MSKKENVPDVYVTVIEIIALVIPKIFDIGPQKITVGLHNLSRIVFECVCVNVPSQDRPWEVTPGRASLQTLQKVGLACEQAYQLCIPEKCSMLNWLAWGRTNMEGEDNDISRLCKLDGLQRWKRRTKHKRTKQKSPGHYITNN